MDPGTLHLSTIIYVCQRASLPFHYLLTAAARDKAYLFTSLTQLIFIFVGCNVAIALHT